MMTNMTETDLSDEDVTNWPEDDDPESLRGDDDEGGDQDA